MRPTGRTPLPDLARALPADDGAKRLPLGAISSEPDPDRLDFLFQLCRPGCFHDAHWIDPRDAALGSASGRLAARSTFAKALSTGGQTETPGRAWLRGL